MCATRSTPTLSVQTDAVAALRTLAFVTVYADLLRYRELFANLFRRDFQAKYRGSVLGILWSLVNPLALMGVYLVVFGLLWKGNTIPHYTLYLLAGLTCWLFFATSVELAAPPW